MKHPRRSIAALSLSAAAFVGIAVHEAYRDTAYLPTPNDVPTIGFGTTEGVKLGDKVTVERALVRLLADADSYQARLKSCIGEVPLHQHEWDAYVSWAYNVGTGAACSSTLVRKLKQSPPDYAGACAELLRWDKQAGKTLRGLTARRQAEYRQCMGPA
ncbi:MAG: lysozyme [Steroidobacteraceae bacterium]